MKTFTTAVRRTLVEPIEFELDGQVYHFMPPKTTAIYITANDGGPEQLRAQLNWLDTGLPAEEAQIIRDRLMDFEDDLETTQLLEIVGWLLKEMSGRPTTPSPESSVRRNSTGTKSTARSPKT